jgi:hypothetical protein
MYKNLNFLEAFEELSNIQDEDALQEDKEARIQKRTAKRINKATKNLDAKTTEWITAILNCEWDLGSEQVRSDGGWHSLDPNNPNHLPLPYDAAEDPNIEYSGDGKRWRDKNSDGTLDYNELRDRVKSNITKNPKNIRDLDLTVHEKLRKDQGLYDTFFDVSPEVLSMDKKEAEHVLQSEYGVSRSSVLKLIHEILLCC